MKREETKLEIKRRGEMYFYNRDINCDFCLRPQQISRGEKNIFLSQGITSAYFIRQKIRNEVLRDAVQLYLMPVFIFPCFIFDSILMIQKWLFQWDIDTLGHSNKYTYISGLHSIWKGRILDFFPSLLCNFVQSMILD